MKYNQIGIIKSASDKRRFDLIHEEKKEGGRFVHKTAPDENYIETLSKIEFHIVLSEN